DRRASRASRRRRPSAAPAAKSMTTTLPGIWRHRLSTSAALRQGRTSKCGLDIRRFSSDSHRGAFSSTSTAGGRGDMGREGEKKGRVEDGRWRIEKQARRRSDAGGFVRLLAVSGVNCSRVAGAVGLRIESDVEDVSLAEIAEVGLLLVARDLAI